MSQQSQLTAEQQQIINEFLNYTKSKDHFRCGVCRNSYKTVRESDILVRIEGGYLIACCSAQCQTLEVGMPLLSHASKLCKECGRNTLNEPPNILGREKHGYSGADKTKACSSCGWKPSVQDQ
jgi:hypothetical protein